MPRRRVALFSAGIVGVALLTIGPWTMHSRAALTRCNAENPSLAEPLPTWVAVTASGPIVFALANNARADGTFQPDALVAKLGGGRLDLRDPAQADLYLHGYRRGWDFLIGNPRAAASLFAKKLALASDAHALGFGLSNWPVGLRGTRRAGVLWLASLLVVAVTLATFCYARFFVQFLPFAFLFHAAALEALISRLRTPAARRGVAWLGAALAVTLTLELAVATSRPRNLQATGSVNPETGKIAQDARVNLAPVSGNN